MGILHKTMSPYHPECNAFAKVFNHTMKHYLQAAHSPPYLYWEQYLPALQISYNTSISKATLATPFSLVLGMDTNMLYFDCEPSVFYNEKSQCSLSLLALARQKVAENNSEYRKSTLLNMTLLIRYRIQHYL